ncbi:MAG: DUF5406 domain-containing protein [Faecalicatena sp.]|uniref:DUF5406 family protein n=1 Tax=Faecalicatena sp. TaxID=2005360 RepID=UPI00258A29A0|nr:DUF5406 family protein [Faecalicatena sp.]MCI6467053.1 DUF5406 domain-containing protein [Faecalicatena sp.]MDY5617470.1 DUF5406 family protein [Lachnospiraceae bacterium]
MKSYDLNKTNGCHVLETIIQFKEYKGRILRTMGGNCLGRTILDFDFEIESDAFYSDCDLKLVDEENDIWKAVLHDKDNNSLRVDGDSKELNDMIVKNEILGQFESREAAMAYVEQLLN